MRHDQKRKETRVCECLRDQEEEEAKERERQDHYVLVKPSSKKIKEGMNE